MPETKNCPLCAAAQNGDLLSTYSEGGINYSLYECASCVAQYWLPFQNPGSSWYEHDNRYADRNQDPILTANKKQIWVLSGVSTTTGRILDVGCGVGNFLAHAKQRGFEDLWGIDFDRDAIEAGKKTFGLEHLEVADLSSFKGAHPDLRFDLVTFFDVFEHLDNHVEFIGEISALLESGGSIALSVPYRHGSRWFLEHDLPPRHLTRWDEISLEKFFSRHGYDIKKTYKLPASFQFMVMKMRFRYGKYLSIGLVKRVKQQAIDGVEVSSESQALRPSGKVRVIHLLAKAKDYVFFGVPAGILWLLMLPTRRRYTDIVIVAERKR